MISSIVFRGAAVGRIRPPDQQSGFDHGDDGVDQNHKGREHEHAGKNAGDVEYALRLLDQVTETGGGTQIFAHDRSHNREAH